MEMLVHELTRRLTLREILSLPIENIAEVLGVQCRPELENVRSQAAEMLYPT